MIRKFNFAAGTILSVVLTPRFLIAASEVVVGYANISARVSPLWIAQEKGFFAKYGVNVQQVYMPGSPVMIASMASGQVHFANSGGTVAGVRHNNLINLSETALPGERGSFTLFQPFIYRLPCPTCLNCVSIRRFEIENVPRRKINRVS